MRNIKKLLALVLVLVMAMSFASAAYADADSITCTEAVDVMSAVGIFNGIDGEFQPNGKLTREQAMKIVAYMLLGQKKADALPKDIQPFEDVENGRWSAGAIAYCASKGIVSGDGTGNFNPTAEVTGYAFGKMVMGAAGIKGEFTGTGWEFNVALALDSYNLLDGIETVVLSQSLTREQAAQMAFNALKHTEGGKATGEYVVEAMSENAAALAMDGEVFADRVDAIVTMNALDDSIELNVDYTLLPVYDYSGSLANDVHGIYCVESYADDFGFDSKVWFNAKGKAIYAEEEEAFLTFANKTMTAGDLHTALGLAKNKTAVAEYYVDGEPAEFTAVRKGTATIGGNGVETSVFWNGYFLEIVEVSTFVGTVTETYKAVEADEAKDIEAVPAKADITVGETFYTVETEAYEKGDVVLVTIAAEKVQSHELAEAVVGTVDKYVAGKTVTVGGTTYKKADNAVALMPGADVAFTVPHIYYTDGVNVYDVAEVDNTVTTTVDGYAYVLGWQIAYNGGAASDLYGDAVAATASAKAKVVNLDGSIEVVDLAVSYDKTTKAYYVADPVTGEATKIEAKMGYTTVGAWAAYELVEGEVSFLGEVGEAFASNKAVKVGSYILTAKTAYTYINVADGVVKTVTGYKNIVVDAADALVVADKNGVVSNIYVVKTTEDEVPNTYANLAYAVEAGASYAAGTEWTFYIDGKAETKIVATEITAGCVYNLTINDKGVVTAVELIADVANATAVEVTLIDEDYFIAGGEAIFFDKDCETYNAKTGAADSIELKDKVVVIDLGEDLDADLIYIVG